MGVQDRSHAANTLYLKMNFGTIRNVSVFYGNEGS